jgi:amino acid transporter
MAEVGVGSPGAGASGGGSGPAGAGAPSAGGELRRDEVGLLGIVVTGVATVAPATSLLFSTAVLASIAGAAVPTICLFATIAVLATGWSLAKLSAAWPSAGSFVTFISRTMGARAALFVATAVLLGLIVVYSGIYYFVGDYLANAFLGTGAEPWPTVMAILFVAASLVPVALGVEIGVRVSLVLLAIEVLVIGIIVLAVVLAGGASGLSLKPFALPQGGFEPIALGFATAIILFTGFEYCVPLAEETRNARRNVPLAVVLSILLVGAIFVVGTWALVLAFDSVRALASSTDPLSDAATRYVSWVEPLVKWVLLSSFLGFGVGLNAAFARVMYRSAQAGLFPRRLGRLSASRGTPIAAALAFAVPPLVIGGVAKLFAGSDQTIPLFATSGTMLVILEYALVNVAAILMWARARRGGQRLGVVGHVLVPLVGIVVLGLPYYYSLKPGQPAPLDLVPWIALGILALAAIYTAVLLRRRPGIAGTAAALLAGERVAGEDEERPRVAVGA